MLVTVTPPTLYATTETVLAYLEKLEAEQRAELAELREIFAAMEPGSRDWIWHRALVTRAENELLLTMGSIRAEPQWHDIAKDPESAYLADLITSGRQLRPLFQR